MPIMKITGRETKSLSLMNRTILSEFKLMGTINTCSVVPSEFPVTLTPMWCLLVRIYAPKSTEVTIDYCGLLF